MFGDGKWHLYDVVNDPSESNPLETEMAERFENMLALYAQYEKDHNLVMVDAEWNAFQAASEAN